MFWRRVVEGWKEGKDAGRGLKTRQQPAHPSGLGFGWTAGLCSGADDARICVAGRCLFWTVAVEWRY